ncbi:tRNA-pseudouridine synthase [Coprinopsis cinerea okayama7|uniref:tRNA-pseudouridine synthase n=1 Tax=Coprinopsis cinerea (strain Okayama-7 / 130 / ATCC MYA-4618 / FGSC 9003) TaxID=240176 RepID=A8N5J1_COPC7|nr:tRNA-pseudouridine synthase [Coprinopsis cinerea okayama7\|eukprot:XP_001830136.1 tRNA-pseudouridine synthase [Coprinopsis cinerea okayama7\
MPPSPQITLLSQLNRSTKTHYRLIPVSPLEQFRHNIYNLIRTTLMSNDFDFTKPRSVPAPPGLKKIAPYWYPYTTMTKMRWIGRELLEVVSTEFRDRSMEYYRYALESGVTTVNGQVASPTTILKDGDRIENVVHRHEPPVTDTPVRILHRDDEREFIVVDKPGSIPVHASGRYYKNTLIEILVHDFGIKKCYPANRLDRLTSGLMIMPLSPERARTLTEEFTAGTVKKEYVARVKGKFPEGSVVCEQPLLTVDRQMGLNIVHPDGKPAKTVFTLIRYDENTNSSVVKCEPHTGRSHQLRVHLQYLGHPIANDPIYSEERIWGKKCGKGGIDTTPSNERSAPAPPPHLQALTECVGSPESLSKDASPANGDSAAPRPKLLPRETGDDIGMGSPVPLSAEAVGVITRLRNMKDEDEDWSRWRDVVFRVKGALNPHHLVVSPPPLPNKRKKGGKATLSSKKPVNAPTNGANDSPPSEPTTPTTTENAETTAPPNPPQYTEAEIVEKVKQADASPDGSANTTATIPAVIGESDNLYCPECYLPLHPDPKPEKLYIFLHARKYTTSLGSFETEMPEWAAPGWTWDQS